MSKVGKNLLSERGVVYIHIRIAILQDMSLDDFCENGFPQKTLRQLNSLQLEINLFTR
jgi:hypothetical protein